MPRTIQWGIIGLGQIAARFAGNLLARTDARIVAVSSRDRSKANAFAARCGATAVVGLEALAASDLEIVYIASPHALHAEQAVYLLQAGKSVLIEKPIAMSAAEARAIASAAKANGQFAMEAMWMRFIPAVVEARRLVAAGAIGTPLQFEGNLGFGRVFDPAHRLFDPKLGGGALLDLGVYPISLAVDFLGPALACKAVARRASNGVDLSASLSLLHAEAISTISTSLIGEGTNDATIIGSEGRIRLQRPLYAPVVLTIARSRVTVLADSLHPLPVAAATGRRNALKQAMRPLIKSRPVYRPFMGDGFVHQIDEVHRCLMANLVESPVMPLEESIAVMDIIDQARAA
jgi:predicted dehydrogenase